MRGFKVTDGASVVISARDLCVSRGGSRVLDGVSLDVVAGEVLAIRGDSGAGKSTLLAALCGLLVPDSGIIRVRGERFDSLPDRARSAVRLRSFGLVFQGDELLPELTLVENVTLPLRLGSRPRRTSGYREMVTPLFGRLGIAPLADRLPSQVSGGQLQRAAVARAVIHRPAVVLADEPTESLDTSSARTAMRTLITLARERGAAVVVVTHDEEVAAACDRSLAVVDGRLVTGRAHEEQHA